MGWVIGFIILLGIILLILEFFVFPGTTIFGIGGVVLIGVAVYLAYDNLGNTIGHYTLAGAILVFIVALIFAFRPRTWKYASLHEAVEGKVNMDIAEDAVQKGDTGIALTRLAPMGKILLKNKTYEGKALNQIIDPDTEIEVVKVHYNQIIVKPKNT